MLVATSPRVVSLSGTTHRMGEHLGDRRLLEPIRNKWLPAVPAQSNTGTCQQQISGLVRFSGNPSSLGAFENMA